MKKLLQLKAPKYMAIALGLLPLAFTVLIWIVIYALLRDVAIGSQSAVVDYGPGAVVVYCNRRRIRGMVKHVKQIIVKE